MNEEFYKLFPYKVPKWANHLQNIPSQAVKVSTTSRIYKYKCKI